MTPTTDHPPAAYLFSNGNAIYVDEDGEQLTAHQRDGLAGLHAYREDYPDATIHWAVWPEHAFEIPDESVDNLLRYIRAPALVDDEGVRDQEETTHG